MDKESNKISSEIINNLNRKVNERADQIAIAQQEISALNPSTTPSTRCAAANRKEIINYLNHKVNEQADRIWNAQQEISSLKTVLTDVKQRFERIKNAHPKNDPSI